MLFTQNSWLRKSGAKVANQQTNSIRRLKQGRSNPNSKTIHAKTNLIRSGNETQVMYSNHSLYIYTCSAISVGFESLRKEKKRNKHQKIN
jgi:hypothetical protein